MPMKRKRKHPKETMSHRFAKSLVTSQLHDKARAKNDQEGPNTTKKPKMVAVSHFHPRPGTNGGWPKPALRSVRGHPHPGGGAAAWCPASTAPRWSGRPAGSRRASRWRWRRRPGRWGMAEDNDRADVPTAYHPPPRETDGGRPLILAGVVPGTSHELLLANPWVHGCYWLRTARQTEREARAASNWGSLWRRKGKQWGSARLDRARTGE